MGNSYRIFDRSVLRSRRVGHAKAENFFLFEEAAKCLAERLKDINRTFKKVLAIGQKLSPDMLHAKPDLFVKASIMEDTTANLLVDEEALPFAEETFDLVLSNLTLHWINDLPGTLVQIRRILCPDGLFLGVMLGGETLTELRESLLTAESELEDGASPRVAPFVDVRDAGNLLQRAGFALPVTDIDTLHVNYRGAEALMKDLKAMGENNAMVERRKSFSRKETMMRAIQYYHEHFGDQEGRITTTFQFVHLAGWAPGPGQPQALQPGSAAASLKDVLKDKS